LICLPVSDPALTSAAVSDPFLTCLPVMTVAAYAPPVETAANIAIVDITLAYVMRARNATR
jgi:hypothetical protein